MDFDVLTLLNWRDALILIVALLTVYVLVALLRMRRLRHEKVAAAISAQSAVAAYTAASEPEPEPGLAPRAEPDFPWNEPPPEIPGQQAIDRLKRELAQLRGEVAKLRAELEETREEFRRELSQNRTTHGISPVYSDAMQMAMQGHDAQTISEHCSVARAEAELVVALVRSR